MKPRIDIVIETLRQGPRTLAELTASLKEAGYDATNRKTQNIIQNIRKFRGAEIHYVKRQYVLKSILPRGVRRTKDGFQFRHVPNRSWSWSYPLLDDCLDAQRAWLDMSEI